MPSFELHVAEPSSSVLQWSPDLSPLKSQLVPSSLVAQPRGPLHGVSMNAPAWQASSRLPSMQRASPLSHELPTPGLQLERSSNGLNKSATTRNHKARPSLAGVRTFWRAIRRAGQ